YVPYQPVYLMQDSDERGDQYDQPEPPEEYRGGPTVFDRRGPGTQVSANSYPSDSYRDRVSAPQPEERPVAAQPEGPVTPQAETPVADQPQTVLVFKDGHQVEVQNYAVVGSTLFDFTPGRQRKIAMSELDLEATAKQNDQRGIDFRLPPKGE